MALKFNNTDINKVIFNGTEKFVLNFNGTCCFCKQFTLKQQTALGTTLNVYRNSSPNQRASTGTLYSGNSIYYGDSLTISCTANSGYNSPELRADIGDGNGLQIRTNPFTFNVVGDVAYLGIASTGGGSVTTEWTGSQTYTASGSFTVPGLSNYSNFEVTASVQFAETYFEENSEYPGNEYTVNISNRSLPATITGSYANVSLTCTSGRIDFQFNISGEYSKGFYLMEEPVSITFTKVKGKV